MKKWYICTLIVTLALLSFLSKEQTIAPNQQIILQFTDNNVSSDKTQSTINTVKTQLKDLGVETIKVEKQSNGKLKISYYSTIDIASVKEKISNERTLAFDSFPKHSNKNDSEFPNSNEYDYNVHVYELLDVDENESGLDGRFVLEPRLESDRFFNPSVYFFVNHDHEGEENRTVKVAYKVRRNITIALNHTLRYSPEVRAGPITTLLTS